MTKKDYENLQKELLAIRAEFKVFDWNDAHMIKYTDLTDQEIKEKRTRMSVLTRLLHIDKNPLRD